MARRKKPIRFSQRTAWASNAYQLGLRWRDTAKLIAGETAVVLLICLWPGMFLREAFIGFTIGAVAATLAIGVARFDDPQVRGDLAEQWTSESLGKVRGWQVTNSLTFYDGDVDHVAVTPSGVLAVETKYRHRQTDRARLAEQRRNDLAAAGRAARRTENVLRSLGHSAPVTPVLIVWGKGRAILPEGFKLVGDTYVVDGDHPWMWSHLFNAPTVPLDTRTAITAALTEFQRKQIVYAEQHQTSRSRLCWTEFRAGMREERAEHARRRSQRRNLRRRHQQRTVSVDVRA